MERQIVTLFRVDAAGRLLAVNEPDAPLAPRLFVGRTSDGDCYRFRHDLPDEVVTEIEIILADEPVLADIRDPPVTLTRLLARLEAHIPVVRVWQGPAWYVPHALTWTSDIETVAVTAASIGEAHFPWLRQELIDIQPCHAVIVDGQAVAVCWSARTSMVAAEAGVETAEGFRGRGYAAVAVAAWARAVQESGRRPLYSTSWDNIASQGVARTLGLELYGADLHIT